MSTRNADRVANARRYSDVRTRLPDPLQPASLREAPAAARSSQLFGDGSRGLANSNPPLAQQRSLPPSPPPSPPSKPKTVPTDDPYTTLSWYRVEPTYPQKDGRRFITPFIVEERRIIAELGRQMVLASDVIASHEHGRKGRKRARERRLAAARLQAPVRGQRVRRHMDGLHAAATVIANAQRRHLARRRVELLRAEVRRMVVATTLIEKQSRAHIARREYLRQKEAATRISAHLRGHLMQSALKQFQQELDVASRTSMADVPLHGPDELRRPTHCWPTALRMHTFLLPWRPTALRVTADVDGKWLDPLAHLTYPQAANILWAVVALTAIGIGSAYAFGPLWRPLLEPRLLPLTEQLTERIPIGADLLPMTIRAIGIILGAALAIVTTITCRQVFHIANRNSLSRSAPPFPPKSAVVAPSAASRPALFADDEETSTTVTSTTLDPSATSKPALFADSSATPSDPMKEATAEPPLGLHTPHAIAWSLSLLLSLGSAGGLAYLTATLTQSASRSVLIDVAAAVAVAWLLFEPLAILVVVRCRRCTSHAKSHGDTVEAEDGVDGAQEAPAAPQRSVSIGGITSVACGSGAAQRSSAARAGPASSGRTRGR